MIPVVIHYEMEEGNNKINYGEVYIITPYLAMHGVCEQFDSDVKFFPTNFRVSLLLFYSVSF